MSDYQTFLAQKRRQIQPAGCDAGEINDCLFDFQRAIVRWACRKGRAAVFADTGLGKSFIQLEWARQMGERTLILAPLSVAHQTVEEGQKLDIEVTYVRSAEAAADGISITNYGLAERFEPSEFGAVVLDEASILKAFDGKMRTRLIEMFQQVPYRLTCTATPAPNDIAEMANQAEFLSVMSRVEMLATFFVHDETGWRMKGHAAEAFYRWLASWAVSLKHPSDLGFSDDGYRLPGLDVTPLWVSSEYAPEGHLFAAGLRGIGERSLVRRETAKERVRVAAEWVLSHDEPCIAWCGLNVESSALTKMLGTEAIEIKGSDSLDSKIEALRAFTVGEKRVLVTKPRIAGFGMNFQHCARMVFVGLNDSYEQFYQAVRRCYRYGQKREVEVRVVLSEAEAPILDNVQRKEREAQRMSENLVKNVAEFEKVELAQGSNAEPTVYVTDEVQGQSWTLFQGDCIERLGELNEASVDFSVFSPPFQSLYTYSATERDLGNSTKDEFWSQFGFFVRQMLRVMKPGRLVACHVSQLPLTLVSNGVIGVEDFRGAVIRAFSQGGFIYHGEVCIDKNPQAQAIRTHSKGLLFAQLRRDASWLRPAFADYVLLLRAPGENAVPVLPDISNDDWITWAHPIWYGIRETDTLNVAQARSQKDERHICPLQLPVIERCIRLWSNPGELVLSPFAGIGSEGHEAVRLGRRFVGIELKPEYFNVAAKNLQAAELLTDSLF